MDLTPQQQRLITIDQFLLFVSSTFMALIPKYGQHRWDLREFCRILSPINSTIKHKMCSIRQTESHNKITTSRWPGLVCLVIQLLKKAIKVAAPVWMKLMTNFWIFSFFFVFPDKGMDIFWSFLWWFSTLMDSLCQWRKDNKVSTKQNWQQGIVLWKARQVYSIQCTV